MKDRFKAEIVIDPETNDYMLQISDEMNETLGWNIGDTIRWTDLGDGSWSIKKVNKEMENPDMELVLVEAIQSYRMRYLVQVPKGKEEWAGDTVVSMEAKEFSQLDIGENIISSRVISYEDALALCRKDNDYISSWPDELVVKNMFTLESDYNGNKTNTSKEEKMG